MNANDKLIRSLAVWFCLFLCFALGTEADAQLRRAPYLQLATPNSVYVVWRTEGPSEPVVRYGPTPTKLVAKASRKTNVQEIVRMDLLFSRRRPHGGCWSSDLAHIT